MMGRAPCCEEVGVKKGPWTPEEDEKLMDYISKNGHGSWKTVPKKAGLNRCGKSCRLRWTNYLRPDIKRGKFTDEEEEIIIKLHSVLGNKWSRIAGHLPGRTDNEIKNFWNTHIRKKLLQMGIDPETHKPRTDFNHLMNLSQLLDISNFCNLMNPWTNPLNIQADVTQLAQTQILQNLSQIINSNVPLGNMTNSTPFLNHNNLNPMEALLNRTNNLQYKDPFLIGQEHANSGLFSRADSDGFQDISKSWTNIEGGSKLCNGEVLDTSHGNQAETKLPALVAVTPGTGNLDQMDSGCNVTAEMCSSQSLSSTTFEASEKFTDDETNISYWKELLYLTLASESATS